MDRRWLNSAASALFLSTAIIDAACSPESRGVTYTYYVSNSGNDSNSGTSQSSPWKTIAKVQSFLGNLRGGDSLLFQRGGIWYEELNLSNVNGSVGSRIIFGNYGSGNLPIIDGGGTKSGNSAKGGRQWCMGGSSSKISYITIDGFECRYASNYGIAFVNVSAGSAGITVQNSYIHDTGDGDYGYHNQLMYADYEGNADGTKFLNNRVGNCYGHNCIEIHGDTGSPLIQGNECYGWLHNCIDLHYAQAAVVDNNIVHDGLAIQPISEAFYLENGGEGAWVSTTVDVTWTRNVVYGSGFTVAFQCGHAGGPVTCYVYNNTVYSNATGAFGGSDFGDFPKLYVKNNIFDTPTPSGGDGFVEWDYNVDVQGGSVPSVTGSHELTRVNPMYVKANGYDFRLQSGSPVIDKGTNVNLTYTGSAPDLGAFEYGSGAASNIHRGGVEIGASFRSGIASEAAAVGRSSSACRRSTAPDKTSASITALSAWMSSQCTKSRKGKINRAFWLSPPPEDPG